MGSLFPSIGLFGYEHTAAAAKRLPCHTKNSMGDLDEEGQVYESPRTPLFFARGVEGSLVSSTMGSRSPTDGSTRRTSTPTKVVDAPVGWATKGSHDHGWDRAGSRDLKPRMSLFAAMEQNQKNHAPRHLKVSVNLEDKALLVALCKLPPRQEKTLRRPAPPRFFRCNSSKVIPTLGERVQKLREANALRAPEPALEPAYTHEAAPPCLFPGISSKVGSTLIDRVQKLRAGNSQRVLEPAPEPEHQHDTAALRLMPLSPQKEEKPKNFQRKKKSFENVFKETED